MATSRARKKPDGKPKDEFLSALEFVALAQKNIGTALQTHCIVRDGWCVASDNVLTMGTKVSEDLASCPQTSRLIAALKRCEETVSFTQLDTDRLSVKSGKLTVKIPCAPIEAMQVLWADPLIAPLGAAFVDGCRMISHLASDGGQAIHLSSLLGRGQTLRATTGRVLVEYWHGFNTPPYWVLPKPAITALMKVDKTLVGLGFSGRSATFHFEDNSWLKTQLYEDKWPNGDSLFDKAPASRTDIPKGLFEAVNILSEFSKPGAHIRFKDEMIELDSLQSEHAEYNVAGVKHGAMFGLMDLVEISKMTKTLDYQMGDKAALFTGDRLRGLVSMAYDKVNDPKTDYDAPIPF